MATLNMDGPYFFNEDIIDNVLNDTSIGNYALGYINDKGTFVVCYVGRSTDQPLKDRLKQHIGENPQKYKRFKYSYAKTKKEAYLKECKNYHDFGGKESLQNENHPAKLPDDETPCPVCGE